MARGRPRPAHRNSDSLQTVPPRSRHAP
jgi:hypothetical protein